MKKYSLFILVLLACLTAAFTVCAQANEITLIGGINSESPVSRMVWDESGEWITLISRDTYYQCQVDSAAAGQSYTFNEKNFTQTTVSESGVAAALSEDRTAIIIYEEPLNPEKAVTTIDPGFTMLSVSVSKDGSQVLADSAEQIRTVVFDIVNGSTIYDLDGFETAAPVYDSTLSADGTEVVWHSRGTFAIQNAADKSFGKTISLWDFASAYELSPDNSVLAVAIINDDYENGAVIFFDPVSGEEKGRVLIGSTAPYELSFSDDGSVLWAADAENIYKIDPNNYSVTGQTTIGENGERVSRVASSPDGDSAAVLDNSGNVYLVHE